MRRTRVTFLAVLLAFVATTFVQAKDPPKKRSGARFVDLSLLVAPNYPCTWAGGWPFFQMNRYRRIGPLSAYNSEILTIDPNTGTQVDVPPHSIPRPGLKLPNAGPAGEIFNDKVPAWQFGGEACVIDVRGLLNQSGPGRSPLINKQIVMAWEKKYRPLGPGDIVCFRSDYSDKYYKALPAGRRFLAIPLEKKAPAWPDPDPECMEYLATRKVMQVVVDSPSMGPMPSHLAEPVHIAGLRHGMIFTEGARGLGKLPTTGGFYCVLCTRHADCQGAEARSFGVVGRGLAKRLIDSVRKKRVIDLTAVLRQEHPMELTAPGVGNHRQPYFKIKFKFSKNVELFQVTHMMDSHAGTHLIPPTYALPGKRFNNKRYSKQVQAWLAEYEKAHGKRGTSNLTTEKISVGATSGNAKVIDVRDLVGTTKKAQWPASPMIGKEFIQNWEKKNGALGSPDVVIFHTGHVVKHYAPMTDGGTAMIDDPLQGKSEGWPALSVEGADYLASRGVRCVATDAPALGSADPKQSLFTYWKLGTKKLMGVEYLVNLDKIPTKGGYFVFGSPKIRGCNGGSGRALLFY